MGIYGNLRESTGIYGNPSANSKATNDVYRFLRMVKNSDMLFEPSTQVSVSSNTI